MKEKTLPFTKERFEILRKVYETRGYTVINKYRKGIKTIRLGDIVLADDDLDAEVKLRKVK